MISNLQLRALLGSVGNNCAENELNQIRELLITLASIEYQVYSYNKDKVNAAIIKEPHDISSQKMEAAA